MILMSLYYTIPRNNRELQHDGTIKETDIHYTIPRNNRELQRWHFGGTL